MNSKYLDFGSNTKVKFKNITLRVAQNGRFERGLTSETKEKNSRSNEAQSRLIDYYCHCCNK